MDSEELPANDEVLKQPGAHAFVPGRGKGGEPGEGGVSKPFYTLSNEEFIAHVFTSVPDGATPATCSKTGDPTAGSWVAVSAKATVDSCPPTYNNYFNCSSFKMDAEGGVKARIERFAACHALMLDDIGKKVPLDVLQKFPFSWVIETSKGNHQAGIILATPMIDASEAKLLLDAIIAAGMCDPGSSGPASRWARLPVAINGKEAYRDESGSPWKCRLLEWEPTRRYTVSQIVEGLGLRLERARTTSKAQAASGIKTKPSEKQSSHSEVYTPRSSENPVIAALKAEGLYKRPLGDGKHDVTCPWVHEHTGVLDSGTAYFEPDAEYPIGGFCCQHSHRDEYRIGKLLQRLDISSSAAKQKPLIRLVPGELPAILDAAEKVLAQQGDHYHSGGFIVSISHNPIVGDYRIVPTSLSTLTKVMATLVDWEKFEAKSQKWVRCDPPIRQMGMLHDAQACSYLPALAGLARQPFFRESDGELVTTPGYDPLSQRYGVFGANDYAFPEPSLQHAKVAMAILERLLTGFHFVTAADRAAAMSAIFTAVVRPSLAVAPGFHVRAPVYGSGKTFLCEVIGAFAGPGHNMKVSYPRTSEEATKMLLSLLMTALAVIEFDDMDSDWKPHGIIKRVFTSEQVADRILGVSRTATVSTRTLFLGSGNNVGPERDLLRRVLTINIDPRCAIPAMLDYAFNPLEDLRRHRSQYVAAVLTVIRAWREAGSPRTDVPNIASYGGAWSDMCRHPLIWMGHPDPVAGLHEQVRHDPDSEALGTLMREWYDLFGSSPITVRRALSDAYLNEDLNDAIRAFPVLESGRVNASKVGWLLKRSANRIVEGFEIKPGSADGRKAWSVVPVSTGNAAQPKTPDSPSLPVLNAPTKKDMGHALAEF